MPNVASGAATVSFDPHAVTGAASGIKLAAVGATGPFASKPAAIVSPHHFVVSDKAIAIGGTEQDLFQLKETVSGSKLTVTWASTGGSTLTEISYLVVGEVATLVPPSDTCGNLRGLAEFGPYSTVALAEQTLASALALMTQAGGGALCIPMDAPEGFQPRNLIQASAAAPGVTVLDPRKGSERRYVPPIGKVMSDGERQACWSAERDLAQNLSWQDVSSTANITSRYTGGASSYSSQLTHETAQGDNHYYIPSLRGLFVGQTLIVVGGVDLYQLVHVQALGLDAAGPHFLAEAAMTDHPVGASVYNKNHVNGLTIKDTTNCDNQSESLVVERATYGNGDSFAISAHLTYQGNIMSGLGDEGGVGVSAQVLHDINCFWGEVDTYENHQLVYRPSPPDGPAASAPSAPQKLGTSRPLINMNQAKWNRSGKVMVVAPGYPFLRVDDEVNIPSSLVIGNQDVDWDESIVGRFIAIDVPTEYYDTNEATSRDIRPLRRVHRWWFISGIYARDDGLTSLYVEETFWFVYPRSGPVLFRFENYTTSPEHMPELDYIIAPGAWVSDVRHAVTGNTPHHIGHATAKDPRLIVLAPSTTDGTQFDFEPGDPITNALGANVWKPTGVRARHFDNFPGMPGASFMAENLGKVRLGAGLHIDSPGARTLSAAEANQKDGEPAYESGIYVFASTNTALTVRGDVKTAAIDLWQVNGNTQRILWRTAAGGSTLYADPTSGDFVFTGGNIDHQHRGTLNQTGISGTPTAARNLRGINVAVPAGATTSDITFATPEPNGPYAVWVTCSWATTTSVSSKTPTGFSILLGTPAPAGGGTLDWLLVR